MKCPHCGGHIYERTSEPGPLTVRQRQLYELLFWTITARGVAPSFDEIAEHFGFRSPATVHEHLLNLERKGWIRREFNAARGTACLVPLTPTPEPAAQ